MIRVLESVTGKLELGEDVPVKEVEEIIDFIRTYADRFHHAKEEDILYARAELLGIPREGGPIGVMLEEHELGREYVRGMADSLKDFEHGGEEARGKIVRNARGYSGLLIQHIDKEDNILYPMIEGFLTRDDEGGLMEEFQEAERERLGDEKHLYYIHLVSRLEGEHIKR
jgi:hemerythrin-like domain-containing protein